jgi:hypothetical protein
MKTKFTPAPWNLSDQYGSEIYNDNNLLIGQTLNFLTASAKQKKDFKVLDISDLDEIMANANLIAAAPELYEALEWCVNYLEIERGEDNNPIEVAEKALAKARGEV